MTAVGFGCAASFIPYNTVLALHFIDVETQSSVLDTKLVRGRATAHDSADHRPSQSLTQSVSLGWRPLGPAGTRVITAMPDLTYEAVTRKFSLFSDGILLLCV